MIEEYEVNFRRALSEHPDLLSEFEKQTADARLHWVGLMEQMNTSPEAAVRWFQSYVKDAGTGRTPLVGL